MYFIHADHLDAPRVVVDDAGRLRWRWLAEPFGTDAPETNPASLGDFVFNPRLPGQYADAESALFHNGWRSYDPSIGRYAQSDPIGLAGGINTYAYVGGNPLMYTDPLGLQALPFPPPPIPGVPNLSVDAQRNLADRLSRVFRNDDETTYQTYTRYNPLTDNCYSGRTSGIDTPENNVRNRGDGQSLLNAEGFLPPVLDRSLSSYNAIRGREQQLIELNGGAQSTGGTSRNKINGIGPLNLAGPTIYIPAANSAFGTPVPAGKCTCQ